MGVGGIAGEHVIPCRLLCAFQRSFCGRDLLARLLQAGIYAAQQRDLIPALLQRLFRGKPPSGTCSSSLCSCSWACFSSAAAAVGIGLGAGALSLVEVQLMLQLGAQFLIAVNVQTAVADLGRHIPGVVQCQLQLTAAALQRGNGPRVWYWRLRRQSDKVSLT